MVIDGFLPGAIIGRSEPVNDIGLRSFTTMCWMSIADLTLRGGLTNAMVELPANTEFNLGRRIGLGDGIPEYKVSVKQFTLYFENDMRCCGQTKRLISTILCAA